MCCRERKEDYTRTGEAGRSRRKRGCQGESVFNGGVRGDSQSRKIEKNDRKTSTDTSAPTTRAWTDTNRFTQSILEFIMADDDADVVQTEFATYEDYLDSQIKPVDMFYLGVRSNTHLTLAVFAVFW